MEQMELTISKLEATPEDLICSPDYKLVCRLCMQKDSDMTYVFNDACRAEDDQTIVQKIYQCTSILIQEHDSLQSLICSQCTDTINTMYDYRQNCIQNQIYLLNLISMAAHDDSETEASPNEPIPNDECEEAVYLIYDDQTASPPVATEEFEVKNEQLLVNSDVSETSDGDAAVAPKLIINELKSGRRRAKLSQHTKEERQQRYQQLLRPCDICGKMMEKSRLEAHSNQHLGRKPYTCDVSLCEKQFYSAYILQRHKRSHHTVNEFKCQICGKPYSLQKSLYNHEQKHKTPRYVCQVCGRKYKNSTYLKEHMRSHTGERPYACSLCSKTFSKSYNLKAHLRSHSKEKPFTCTVCGRSYGYNSLLKSHMEKRHATKDTS